ncbi:hypothetical protein [Bradyrhizobium viridifuturi]|uniref:hypothetical protein n=1 Tax=Bradyrhizobium viridifuturi TaxID=1654716 RepID=UPI003221568E
MNTLIRSVSFFSITKVASDMCWPVSSAGRKNSVNMPLMPQPSCNSHDHGSWM